MDWASRDPEFTKGSDSREPQIEHQIANNKDALILHGDRICFEYRPSHIDCSCKWSPIKGKSVFPNYPSCLSSNSLTSKKSGKILLDECAVIIMIYYKFSSQKLSDRNWSLFPFLIAQRKAGGCRKRKSLSLFSNHRLTSHCYFLLKYEGVT